MSKVRRIDWSPDEWIAGTFGVLTMRQTAVYIVVLMQIYSRGGECPNDATFVSQHFRIDKGETWHGTTRSVRASIDSLIKLGKLHPSPDGQWLTNGRASIELNRARERMGGAVRAGYSSGRARKQKYPDIRPTSARHPPDIHPKSSNANDLTRTSVRIITTKDMNTDLTTSTDAARDPAPDQTAPGRAPTGPDPFSHTKPPPPASPKTAERLAALAADARRRFLKGEP